MKKNIIKKIVLMLASVPLFQTSTSATNETQFPITPNSAQINKSKNDSLNINNLVIAQNKKRLGLISRTINKISRKKESSDRVMHLSPGTEAAIVSSSVLMTENLKSIIKSSDYKDNPFSAEKLDQSAINAGATTPLDKLTWMVDHLSKSNKIKFGRVEALTWAKYPGYLIKKSKLMNLFVSTDRSNLQKDVEYSTSLYKIYNTAICFDNAKILYKWAKLNNLPSIMVIEGIHCYTMIKINNKWYRPEPTYAGTTSDPTLQVLTGKEVLFDKKDRKILLINPNKSLSDQNWKTTPVWDLNMKNLPTWDEVLSVTEKPTESVKYQGTTIKKFEDLRWELKLFY